jgi:plastocyanin
MVSLRSTISLALAALVAVLAASCGNTHEADIENGKRLYTGQLADGQKKPSSNYQPCAACHALARANASGTAGPSLDAAFSQARMDGMTEDTIKGVVLGQIHHPRRGSTMPARLVEGDDATDVAAYVAQVAGEPGEDKGQLAAIGGGCKGDPIAAKGSTLTIPACETGALAYASAEATAPAGTVEIVMPNPSPIKHDIGIKGDGEGAVVGNGGESKFTADLKPGKYEYFCSVPGHEAGGMKGTLTVK